MQPREVVQAWVEAFNRADVAALAAMYSEDATNHQVAERPVVGRLAIREMFASEFARAKMICIVENIFQDGEWAILEWRDPLGLRGCGFFHVVNDRIKFQRGYWDKLSFLRMHGLPQHMTPRLVAAIPKLASLNIERSLAFFERLGFKRRGTYPDYGMIERDGVQIHFWLCTDARIPKETACRITVEGIEDLFKAFSVEGVIHPNGNLALKPWGVWEFSVLDPDGNLVTLQQAAA
jgi:hypothetical protein